MDDLKFGKRNKRGDWAPDEPLQVAPLLVWPWSVSRFVRWLPGFFLPWNLMFFALAYLLWKYTLPEQAVIQTLSLDWITLIWARNVAIIVAFYGALELRLYVTRGQGNRYKYNGKFPSEQPSDVFWFRSQNIDNFLRGFLTGIPIWTAYEVFSLWSWANGWGPWTTFSDNPVWLVVFALLIPIIHEVHFYCIHRLIHTPFLYKWVHSVHHNSVNPSPWSSLSMHPVEHLLYWSDSLIHLVLPSHPLLLIFNLQLTGTGAVVGHVGFDRIETGKDTAFGTHAFAHYLHHKYFEVNYADGTLPLDKWFGTWHDGSKEGDAIMDARFAKLRAKANAKAKAGDAL